MDDGFKQRVIGAVVLAALGVLFLPSLFNTDSRQRVDLTSQIPPEPLDTPTPIKVEEPVRPQDIPQAPPLEQYYPHEDEGKAGSTETAAAESAANKSGKNENTSHDKAVDVTEAWSVQVGSFQSQERAEALKQQLWAGDYKAYVRSSKVDDTVHYRVFVGPKIQKEDALREKAELEKALKVKAILVKFKP